MSLHFIVISHCIVCLTSIYCLITPLVFLKVHRTCERENETDTTTTRAQTQRQNKITNLKQREGWDSVNDLTPRHVRHDAIIKSFFQLHWQNMNRLSSLEKCNLLGLVNFVWINILFFIMATKSVYSALMKSFLCPCSNIPYEINRRRNSISI
jgi:hypothetical protein